MEITHSLQAQQKLRPYTLYVQQNKMETDIQQTNTLICPTHGGI